MLCKRIIDNVSCNVMMQAVVVKHLPCTLNSRRVVLRRRDPLLCNVSKSYQHKCLKYRLCPPLYLWKCKRGHTSPNFFWCKKRNIRTMILPNALYCFCIQAKDRLHRFARVKRFFLAMISSTKTSSSESQLSRT